VGRDIEPFLRKFQSPYPMAPLLYEDLFALLLTLMKRCLKQSFFEKYGVDYQVVGGDLEDKTYFLPPEKVKIGHGAKAEIAKLVKPIEKKSQNSKRNPAPAPVAAVSQLDVTVFQNQCGMFLLLIIFVNSLF